MVSVKEDVSRLLCEGWLKRNVHDPSSLQRPNQLKWKNRFATLMLFDDEILLRFYPKNKKNCKENIEERLSLKPWKTCIHMTHSSENFILTLKIFPNGLNSHSNQVIQFCMKSVEEAVTWMKCIQNLTKLQAGDEVYKFTIKTRLTDAFSAIGCSEKFCILYFSVQNVTLALKSDLTVMAVWPVTSIRCYSSQNQTHFSITAGRSSPLGEATYDFQILDNEASKLFQILDYHTGVTTTKPKFIDLPIVDKRKQIQQGQIRCAHQNTRKGVCPDRSNRQRQYHNPPSKPPRKPPLPAQRQVCSPSVSKLSSGNSALVGDNQNESFLSYSNIDDPNTDNSDLDVLLHSLQYSLGLDEKKSKNSTVKGLENGVLNDCSDLIKELVDKVCKNVDQNSIKHVDLSYSTVNYSIKSLKRRPTDSL